MSTADEHVPGSQKYKRHASRVHEIQRVGNRDDIDPRNGDEFTVAAVNVVAEYGKFPTEAVVPAGALLTVVAKDHRRQQYARAGLDVSDVLAGFDNLTGNVAAENVGQLHSGQTFAYPD